MLRQRMIARLRQNVCDAARWTVLHSQRTSIDNEWDLVQLHRARQILATLEAGESVAAEHLIDEFVAYCGANPTVCWSWRIDDK